MTPPSKVKLTGGVFQDSEGNALAYGYLEMLLNQDASITGVGQVASGIAIKILLDQNGSIEGTSGLTFTSVATSVGTSAVYTGTVTGGANNAWVGLTFVVTGFSTGANNGTFVCTASTATTLTLANASASSETHAATATASQAIWGTDQMFPINAYYRVLGFTVQGQPAWGPNNQQVTGSGGTFDVGTWVPNQVLSWTPPVQAPTLETNGTLNSTQKLLNLTGGGTTTVTESAGTVTISTAAGATNWGSIGGTLASQTDLNSALALKAPLSSIPTVWDFVTWFFDTTNGGYGPFRYTFMSSISGGQNGNAPSTSQFPGLILTSGATNPASCGFYYSANATAYFPFVSRFRWRMNLKQTASSRMWMGFAVGSAVPATWMHDTLGFDFVGFRYSNGVDTNYQCVCNTGGTATVVDSGVATDLAEHIFEFSQSGSTITFYIDGVQVAQISSNVPTSQMGPSFVLDNKASNNVVIFNMYYWKGTINYS